MPAEWHDVEAGRTREHRAGAWLMLLVGLFGLGLGLFHVRKNIVNAFQERQRYKTIEEIERERVEAMKTKDTDGDGLNDFEETYVFKTSPYLADSDSDGIDDRAELERGLNPNCPQGRDCGLIGGAGGFDDSSTGTTALPDAESDVERQYLEQLLNPSPDQVRLFLKNAGVSDEELAGIDDESLMRMYHDALSEAQRERELGN